MYLYFFNESKLLLEHLKSYLLAAIVVVIFVEFTLLLKCSYVLELALESEIHRGIVQVAQDRRQVALCGRQLVCAVLSP